jgi:hypothetical protein
LLQNLAQGYLNSKPQNDIEKEDFLNKAIAYLEDAIYNDQANAGAESLLTVIRSQNFQKMLDKGKELYAKGKKSNDMDMCFNAEYYFRKASEFDIYNEEAKKLLSQVRKETLSVPNIKDDLAIAIVEYKYVTLRNHLANPIPVALENLILTDTEGNTYALDEPFMNAKFAANKFKAGSLRPGDSSGILAFKVPAGKKLEYLAVQMEHGKMTKKYLP